MTALLTIDDLKREITRLESELRASKMTLRDEFAKAAMTGYSTTFDSPSTYSKSLALDCYLLADAMLKARNPMPGVQPEKQKGELK